MELKHIQVKDYILQLIRRGEEQARLPSEKDLCLYMKASRVTIRRAFDDLEHEGLLRRQKGKGAFICKKSGNEKVANFFLGVSAEVKFSPLGDMMAGILDKMRDNGIDLHIFTTNGNTSSILEEIKKHNINGVMGLRPYPHDYQIYDELRQRGYPVLLIDRDLKNSNNAYVTSDFAQASFLVSDHLLSKGHERLLFFIDSPFIPYSHHTRDGFLKAAEKHGRKSSEAGVVGIPAPATEKEFFEAARKAFVAEFKRVRPTAVTCVSELMFRRVVYPFCVESNLRIPADLEVGLCSKTLSDTPLRSLIHEIKAPEYELGALSVEYLKKMAEGDMGRTGVILPVEFISKDFGPSEGGGEKAHASSPSLKANSVRG